MRSKKLIVVLLCVMGLAALSVGTADAAQAWYTCNVNAVGAFSNTYFYTLTDAVGTAFSSMMFFCDMTAANPYKKEQYAAALTAYSTGGKVWVYIDTPPTLYNPIYYLGAIQ